MNDFSNEKVREAHVLSVNWFRRIGAWFAFVNRRRIDRRYRVWPMQQVAASLAGVIVLCALALGFADAPYLAAVRSGATDGNAFFETITVIGKSNWILVASGLVIFAFTFLTADRYSGELQRVWHRLLLTAYFLFTTVAFSSLIALGIKVAFGRKRPPYVDGERPWEAVPFSADYEFTSFPSGHSTTSGALALALAMLFPRFRWWFLCFGMLVAASRNFVGVHFPSDVIAGLAVGGGFTWIYARSFARKRLLFHFVEAGRIGLRGEGRGHLHRWPQLFSKGGKR